MSTVTNRPTTTSTNTVDGIHYPDKPEGPIAAAILAAGVGALSLGAITTLVEASAGIKKAMTLDTAVGPLSGKTIIAVVVWLVAWVILHLVYRRTAYESRRALSIALALIGLGILGTFPTFFQLFGG
jgi:hypothetical protein